MPTPPEGIKEEPAKEEAKPVEETKPVETPRTKYLYKGQYEVDPEQADALMQKGYEAQEAEKEAKSKSEEIIIEDSDDLEKKITKLMEQQAKTNKKIDDALVQADVQRKYTQIASAVDQHLARDSFIKEHPQAKKAVEDFTKSFLFHNPNMPVEQICDQVIAKLKPLITGAQSEYVKKKAAQAAGTKGERTSSGEVHIEDEHKPLTAKEMKAGKGKLRMLALLKSGKAYKE